MRIPSPRGSLVRLLCFFGDDGSYPAYRELACAAWPALNSIKDALLESPARRRLRELLDHVLTDVVEPADPENYAPGCWALAVLGLLEAEDRGTGVLMERWADIPADRLDARDAARREVIIGGPSPHPLMPIPPDEEGTERDLLLHYGTIRFVTVNDMFTSSARAIGAIARLLDDEPATPRPGASPAGIEPGGPDPAASTGYLGLVLDDENRRVTRQGHDGVAEFEGKVLAWALFREFWNNREKYTNLDQIRAIWGAVAITNDPDPNSIQVEISRRLRKILKPIGIGVRNGRGLGYRLIDLPRGARRSSRSEISVRRRLRK
jgi:hypothetical protein